MAHAADTWKLDSLAAAGTTLHGSHLIREQKKLFAHFFCHHAWNQHKAPKQMDYKTAAERCIKIEQNV